MALKNLTWDKVKKNVLVQDLGSWKDIKLIDNKIIEKDNIKDFLEQSKLLKMSADLNNAPRVILGKIEIYFYEKGDFIFDFNPETVTSPDSFKKLFDFIKSLAIKFKVKFNFYDETDFTIALLQVNNESKLEW